jgi:hypothetical protein
VLAVALQRGGAGHGDATPNASDTTSSPEPALLPALERADVHLGGVSDADVAGLIVELCSTLDGPHLAARVVGLGITRPEDIETLVEGIGRGAEQHCPTVPAGHPELVNETYSAAVALLREGG